MEINIQKFPRCLWHTDCQENKYNSGIIKIIEHNDEDKFSLVECLHCGDKGKIPYGAPFDTRICIEDA